MTAKVKQVKPSCVLRLSLQKTTIPSSINPQIPWSWLFKRSHSTMSTNLWKKKDKLQSSQKSCIWNVKIYCPCDLCCACCCCPLLFMLQAVSPSRILLCVCVTFMKDDGLWLQSEVEIKYKFTDKSSRGMQTGVPVCPSVMCTCSEFSVRRVLGRTGWTVGRAGVRWRAGLLLVLRGAVRLQRCHGHWRVFAFGRAAFTAEQFAFNFPEVVAIVKPKEGRMRKQMLFNQFFKCFPLRLIESQESTNIS